jgi:DNA-binding SARP family transcriptional activator
VDVVIDRLFPDASLSVGRSRLRQVLHRLRSAAGDVVERDGDQLRLVPAWVDVREFLVASDRVRGARGSMAVQRAYAALALANGPFLPTDRYAAWADEVREVVEYRYLELLEQVTEHATRIGSYQEALTALDAALAASPDRAERYASMAKQLLALGRERTAEYVAELADASVDDDAEFV